MKKRLDHIDRAKGILIILMVIGHVWQSGFVFELIYAFHMPAFFVISGILMAHTQSYRKPYLAFVRSRILAYGMPFVFIELLGCMTDIIRNGVTLNWKGYLFNTVTFHFNDPNLWFLVNLCLIELLIAVLVRIKNDWKTVLCTAVGLFFIRYALPTEVLYVGTISSVFKYFLFFVIGFYGQEILQRRSLKGWILAAVTILYALFGKYLGTGVIKDIAYVVSGLCGTHVVLKIAQLQYKEAVSRVLSYAGKNTLIIYGTHHVYYAAIGVLLGVRQFQYTPLATGLVILAAVAALEVPTIYVINRWLPFLAGKQRKKPEKNT